METGEVIHLFDNQLLQLLVNSEGILVEERDVYRISVLVDYIIQFNSLSLESLRKLASFLKENLISNNKKIVTTIIILGLFDFTFLNSNDDPNIYNMLSDDQIIKRLIEIYMEFDLEVKSEI
jgi:hypothetical protein